MIGALKLDGKNSHDALDDTLACGELFLALVRRIPTPGEYTYEPDLQATGFARASQNRLLVSVSLHLREDVQI